MKTETEPNRLCSRCLLLQLYNWYRQYLIIIFTSNIASQSHSAHAVGTERVEWAVESQPCVLVDGLRLLVEYQIDCTWAVDETLALFEHADHST